MSEFQRRGRKKSAEPQPAVKEEPVAPVEVVAVEAPVAAAEVPAPKKPEKVEPAIHVDPQKLLVWVARLKSGRFTPYGNGANFGNHLVADCFTVDGKAPSLEEASILVRPFTSRS